MNVRVIERRTEDQRCKCKAEAEAENNNNKKKQVERTHTCMNMYAVDTCWPQAKCVQCTVCVGWFIHHIRTGTHYTCQCKQTQAHQACTILISFSFRVCSIVLFNTTDSHTHTSSYTQRQSKRNTKIVRVCVGLCRSGKRELYDCTCVFQSHLNRIPLDIFLPCLTCSIIRILTHRFPFGYCSFMAVVVVPIFACVCVYLCSLELFCARCCCWLRSPYT